MKDLNVLKCARMRDFDTLRYAKLLTYLQIPVCPLTVYCKTDISCDLDVFMELAGYMKVSL